VDAGCLGGDEQRLADLPVRPALGDQGQHLRLSPGQAERCRRRRRRLGRGRPVDPLVELISATTTRSGLKVRAALDNGAYPLGVKVSDRELAAVPMRRHDWHGEWNYTVLPTAA
jgi:Rhodopirellula transposase DDE domain